MTKEGWSDGLGAPRRPAGRYTPFRVVAHGYVWGLLLLLLAFGVPRLEAIFLDFGAPLPRLTHVVLRASHAVTRSFPPVVTIPLLLLILIGADWLILKAQAERGDDGWTLAWSMLIFAFPLCLIALLAVAMGLPFLTIMTRLSG